MSDTTALSVLPSAASHTRDIGQITAIEQARAVAEVQARVIVAQNNPRDVQAAISEMEMVCQQKLLADRAFFNVPRGGNTITGVSIDLAKELARCWRNVDYEIAELRRDDDKGHSEMLAWAWDMQANNKASIKFQVPHTRDMKTGSKRLNDINQIYELLANMGSRRVREMILKILPTWYVERAKELCYKTLEDGGGVPLPQRIAKAIQTFDGLGVTVDRIEQRFGVKPDKWTPHHLAQLTVILTSLHQNTTTVDDEFPVNPVTSNDLQPGATPPVDSLGIPIVVPAEPAAVEDAGQAATTEQLQKIGDCVNRFGDLYSDATEITKDIRTIVGRSDANLSNLSSAEAVGILAAYEKCLATDNPAAALDIMLDDMRTPEGP